MGINVLQHNIACIEIIDLIVPPKSRMLEL